MKPQSAIIVFLILLASSVLSGIDSLVRAGTQAQHDVDQALTLTLAQCPLDHIDTDTIQVYRSHITMDAVRDTAYLSIADGGHGGEVRVAACTGLTIGRLWAISDQRASGILASLAALWLLLSVGSIRSWHHQPQPLIETNTVKEHVVHFTPMQQMLMDMFMEAPDHRLSQRDICDRLWPKKPDASATLYTLIRRLKPILEQEMNARIECHRGVSYQLVFLHEKV